MIKPVVDLAPVSNYRPFLPPQQHRNSASRKIRHISNSTASWIIQTTTGVSTVTSSTLRTLRRIRITRRQHQQRPGYSHHQTLRSSTITILLLHNLSTFLISTSTSFLLLRLPLLLKHNNNSSRLLRREGLPGLEPIRSNKRTRTYLPPLNAKDSNRPE